MIAEKIVFSVQNIRWVYIRFFSAIVRSMFPARWAGNALSRQHGGERNTGGGPQRAAGFAQMTGKKKASTRAG